MQLSRPTAAPSLDPTVADYFLGRLTDVVAAQTIAPTPDGRAALAQLAFAHFHDCLGLGLDEEAIIILGCLLPEPVAPGREAA